jgi:hypothetical protein
MRRSLVFFLVALVGAFIAALAPRSAAAGPLPVLTDLSVTSNVVEKAQYARRYYRRQLRRGYIPPAVVVPPVVIEGGPVIVVPLRPTSCGQYRYWNGVACVDARYHDPYLGPSP